MHGPGEGDVEEAQRFLDDPLLMGGEHPLELGREDGAEVFGNVAADALDAGGRFRAAGDDFRRLAADAHI